MFRAMRLASALVLGAASLSHAAEKPWIEARSSRFTVVTNGSEGDARATLRQFEQIHAVFRSATGGVSQESGKPFTIIAARDEATMKRLLPAFWERKGATRPGGVFYDDPTRVFVVLRVDDRPSATWSHSIVFHEYVHFMAARQSDTLPLWLNEGIAEFYASCSVENDRVIVGRAAPWNLQLLQERAPLPIETLLAVDTTSPLYNEQSRSSIFYGQSWAIVHYLLNGNRGAEQPRLASYLALIGKGVDSVEAGRQAFGDLKAFERQIASYVRGYQFFMRPIPTPQVPAEKTFETRPLPPAEALALQAMLHAVTRRTAEARAEAEEAVRLDPNLSLGWQALARVQLDQEQMEDALRAAGEAVRADPLSAGAHHLLGSIAWRRGDTATAETEMARAVEINNALTVSQVMLAVLRNGLGRPNDQVIPHVRRAVELEPGNAHFQLMLSAVLHDRGDVVNARRLGERALRMARTPEERARVQEAMVALERPAARRSAATDSTSAASSRPAPPKRDDTPLTVDDAQAFKLYGGSCEAGEPRGCEAAGDALRLGRGVARDLAQAAGFYEKGCDGGGAPSCHRLALLYAAGEGVARDLVKAKSLFAKACQGGHQPACKRAAN
jgi:tetratricopeptide (TPR) repeat protein